MACLQANEINPGRTFQFKFPKLLERGVPPGELLALPCVFRFRYHGFRQIAGNNRASAIKAIELVT